MKSDINAIFDPITSVIYEREDAIFHRVKDAEDIDEVRDLSDQLRVIDRMRNAIDLVKSDFNDLWRYDMGDEDDLDEEHVEQGLRRISVEITEGMINQSLLSLTKAAKKGIVRLKEEMTIVLPDEEKTRFKTQIVPPGNKLRDRSHIRQLYDIGDASVGDLVILQESEPGLWKASIRRGPRSQRKLQQLLKEYGI